MRDGCRCGSRRTTAAPAGPEDAPFGLELHQRARAGLPAHRAAATSAWPAPTSPATCSSHGVHPGDPYDALVHAAEPPEVPHAVARRGWSRCSARSGSRTSSRRPRRRRRRLPRWRRIVEGLRHSMGRDAEAIHHHYDVSNRVLRAGARPVDDLHLRGLPAPPTRRSRRRRPRSTTWSPASSTSSPGSGCSTSAAAGAAWSGTPPGSTASRRSASPCRAQQASWAKEAIEREGLGDLAEVRHLDYRDVVEEAGFDAVSSIGLTEHIGVRNYPAYFGFLRDQLRPEGRLLNHCITRPRQPARRHRRVPRPLRLPRRRADRLGPDHHRGAGRRARGACTRRTSGVHYALTLAGWCRNLEDNWDECVAEVGEGTARVWGLYMAGSRLGFERNEIQLHQVLAAKTDDDGDERLPAAPRPGDLRP